MAKMTAKQMRFCDEYLIDLNATQAAIRAGYSEKYAHTNAAKLLQITTIKDFLAQRMAEKQSELIADQDEVLRFLTAVMRGEEKDEKIQRAMVDIKQKFGKNAIVKGMNLEDGATAISRNEQIGGHKA